MRSWNFQGNVIVANLSEHADPAALAALFDDFGLVIGVQIKEQLSNAGRNILGIVALAPDKAADEAIQALQGTIFDGRKVNLRRAKPRPKVTRKALVKPAPGRIAAPSPSGIDPAIQAPGRTIRLGPMGAVPATAGEETADPGPRRETRKVLVEYRSLRPRILPPRSRGGT